MSVGHMQTKKAKKAKKKAEPEKLKPVDELMISFRKMIEDIIEGRARNGKLECWPGMFTDQVTQKKGVLVVTARVVPLRDDLQPKILVAPSGGPINGKLLV